MTEISNARKFFDEIETSLIPMTTPMKETL